MLRERYPWCFNCPCRFACQQRTFTGRKLQLLAEDPPASLWALDPDLPLNSLECSNPAALQCRYAADSLTQFPPGSPRTSFIVDRLASASTGEFVLSGYEFRLWRQVPPIGMWVTYFLRSGEWMPDSDCREAGEITVDWHWEGGLGLPPSFDYVGPIHFRWSNGEGVG